MGRLGPVVQTPIFPFRSEVHCVVRIGSNSTPSADQKTDAKRKSGSSSVAFSPITTKRYTGQYHEAGLPGGEGLSYYNARWYDAQLGRFVSTDTLVPDPMNPQSLIRLAYVYNNPLRYVDPTGHRLFEDNGNPATYYPSPKKPYTPPTVDFVGSGWTAAGKQAVRQATTRVGNRIASTVNSMRRFEAKVAGLMPTLYKTVSGIDAFLGVFDGPITVEKTSKKCDIARDCVAKTSNGVIYVSVTPNPHLIVHEIFHLFDLNVLIGAANQTLHDIQVRSRGYINPFPDRPDLDGESSLTWGFAGGNFSNWQKSRLGLSGEEFADMGIGWTYGRWDSDADGLTDDARARSTFMNTKMSLWLSQLLP